SRLARLFGLCRFQLDVLLLALAPELDPRYGALIGFTQGDPARQRPTIDLALNLFCRSLEERIARLDLLAPGSTLVSEGLSHTSGAHDAAPRPEAPYKLDAPIVDYLLGRPPIDARINSIRRLVSTTVSLDGLHLSPDLRASLESAVDGLRHRIGAFLFVGR